MISVLRTDITSLPMNTSKLATVVAKEISSSWKRSVLTRYDLGVLLLRHLLELDLPPETNDDSRLFKEVCAHLEETGILTPRSDFPGDSVFQVFGRSNSGPDEVVCGVDPFAYVSHLSAMQVHGLTDRLPKVLYVSTPSHSDWKQAAARTQQKDVGAHANLVHRWGLPPLQRIRYETVGRTPIQKHASLHLGAYKLLREGRIRVATIGRTFLDMLREPSRCGGMQHVLDTFRESAGTYLQLILSEVEQHGRPIDRVRAGYVLEEVCELRAPIIEGWLTSAQRGGSRKLDPNADFDGTHYSERWCISVNV